MNKKKISEEDLKQIEKISPIINWKKVVFNTPKLPAIKRHQRRLSHRNLNKLYRTKCPATGKEITSIYNPRNWFKSYDIDYRRSDNRNPLEYEQTFDSSTTFFHQFHKLSKKIPLPALSNVNCENCDMCNSAWNSNDCYNSFRVHACNYVYYSYRPNNCNNCLDSYQIKGSEFLYESVYSNKCSYSNYLYWCANTHNSDFLRNCNSCNHCFLCFDLDWANYCILNKQYTKNKYHAKINNLKKKWYVYLKKSFFKILETRTYRYSHNKNSTSSSGDYLINCENCFDCYMLNSSRGCRYSRDSIEFIDCMDTYSWSLSNECYESTALYRCSNVYFSIRMRHCNNCYYSKWLFHCKHCFGCIWLKYKEYCIFNKQYTKNEYEIEVEKIMDYMKQTWEWWEFFPMHISPFCYNESLAQDFFPLSQSEVLDQWLKRLNVKEEINKDKEILSVETIPDIKNIHTNLFEKVIQCESSWRLFKIIPEELLFYCKFWLPIPTIHPDERSKIRRKFLYKTNQVERLCNKCGEIIQSCHTVKERKNVYCEKCYRQWRHDINTNIRKAGYTNNLSIDLDSI